MAKKKSSSKMTKTGSIFSRFALNRIRMVSSTTGLRLKPGPPPTKHKISISVISDYRRESRLTLVVLSCRTGVFYEVDDQESAIDIECKYLAEYRCTSKAYPSAKTLDSNESDLLLGGVMQLWPYVRSFVQDVSAKMAVPPVVLPIAEVIQDPKTGEPVVHVGGSPIKMRVVSDE